MSAVSFSGKRILWLGALQSDLSIQHNPAANPAAAIWTRGLLDGLKQHGVQLFGLTHCYERLWPCGRLVPGHAADFIDNIALQFMRYPNLLHVREAWLARMYTESTKRLLSSEKFDALICYNTLHPYHVAATRVARKFGVPSFAIILDGDDPQRDNWRALLRESRYANGLVFLSRWACDKYPGALPVLHMDGGAKAWHGGSAIEEPTERFVLYSGSLDHWRGRDIFKEVVRLLAHTTIKFVVCGKTGNLNDELSQYRNVEFKGFVSHKELRDLHLKAWLFISTRDPALGDNYLNFPSKILNYLSYGKPVISTWMPSFSVDYRDVLIVPRSNATQELAESIKGVWQWSDTRRREYRDVVKKWFCANKVWGIQAGRVLSWMFECYD